MFRVMGISSFMFVGSNLPYEENVRRTKDVVLIAHLRTMMENAGSSTILYHDVMYHNIDCFYYVDKKTS